MGPKWARDNNNHQEFYNNFSSFVQLVSALIILNLVFVFLLHLFLFFCKNFIKSFSTSKKIWRWKKMMTSGESHCTSTHVKSSHFIISLLHCLLHLLFRYAFKFWKYLYCVIQQPQAPYYLSVTTTKYSRYMLLLKEKQRLRAYM